MSYCFKDFIENESSNFTSSLKRYSKSKNNYLLNSKEEYNETEFKFKGKVILYHPWINL